MFFANMIIVVMIVIIVIIYFLSYYIKKVKYDKSAYKKESKNEFKQVYFNKGNYGEYLIFNNLECIDCYNKIITNAYIPKGNGETTEVDLIFIHQTGIYVIESKNYSGWIFGDEKNKTWMQTFKTGRKEKFYNPIRQNNTHIKYLEKVLQLDNSKFKSIIVFSQRCTLKKIKVESENISVINRNNLILTIQRVINKSKIIFSDEEIIAMYNSLKPYTCVSNEAKLTHISQIKNRQNLQSNTLFKKDINGNNITKELVDTESSIYLELKKYRIRKSEQFKIKPYHIFNNEELNSIVREKPRSVDELKRIHGFGVVKCEKYGEDIVNIIKEYS